MLRIPIQAGRWFELLAAIPSVPYLLQLCGLGAGKLLFANEVYMLHNATELFG